jgi:hypothetical protein
MTDAMPGDSIEPELDIDAMLADLHANFPELSEEGETTTEGDGGGDVEASGASTGDAIPETGVALEPGEEQGGASAETTLAPPGMVEVDGEYIPVETLRAYLTLDRQAQADPVKAERLRQAIVGDTGPAPGAPAAPDPNALPEWIDPNDTQAVFLYRQQQHIADEIRQLGERETLRLQQQQVSADQARRQQVIDAWNDAIRAFAAANPGLTQQDLHAIANRAGELGMLDNPERVGGSLREGFAIAMDTAVWSTPALRERVAAGGTVPSQEQLAEDRKRKSSALSSTSGSTPRTNQTEQPQGNTREAVMGSALDWLRTQGDTIN